MDRNTEVPFFETQCMQYALQAAKGCHFCFHDNFGKSEPIFSFCDRLAAVDRRRRLNENAKRFVKENSSSDVTAATITNTT